MWIKHNNRQKDIILLKNTPPPHHYQKLSLLFETLKLKIEHLSSHGPLSMCYTADTLYKILVLL